MIGHGSSDERGKYSGGKAGDNNGMEVCTRSWYNRPWNVVFWAKDATIREKMAKAMEEACANNNIGYDQNERTTLYEALRKVGFKMSKVNTPCETDCSALVACCAICAGVEVSKDIYTGNEKNAFQKTGLFEFHSESKYLTSDKYLPRGAVLLYEGHHTAINLTNGSEWTSESFTGWVTSGSKKYYYRNGKKLVKEWVKDNGYWYRLGNTGEMLTGFHLVPDNGINRPCYFDAAGRLYHEASDHQGYLEVWKEN